MMGKKDSTLPTPASTPSTTSDFTTGFVPNAVSASSIAEMPVPTSCSMRPCRGAPTAPNVSQKTAAMMSRNIGMAV